MNKTWVNLLQGGDTNPCTSTLHIVEYTLQIPPSLLHMLVNIRNTILPLFLKWNKSSSSGLCGRTCFLWSHTVHSVWDASKYRPAWFLTTQHSTAHAGVLSRDDEAKRQGCFSGLQRGFSTCSCHKTPGIPPRASVLFLRLWVGLSSSSSCCWGTQQSCSTLPRWQPNVTQEQGWGKNPTLTWTQDPRPKTFITAQALHYI